MKKILSILSTISLSTIITKNIIACQQPNTNNENNKPNKPIEPQFTPQQPPKNSNGRLNERSISSDNKGYIAIVKKKKIDDFSIIKFNFSNKSIGNIGAPYHIINGTGYIVNSFYQGQNNNEPTTPTINKNTGEITDGNEKI